MRFIQWQSAFLEKLLFYPTASKLYLINSDKIQAEQLIQAEILLFDIDDYQQLQFKLNRWIVNLLWLRGCVRWCFYHDVWQPCHPFKRRPCSRVGTWECWVVVNVIGWFITLLVEFGKRLTIKQWEIWIYKSILIYII